MFKVIVTREQITNGKPSPEGFLVAAKLLKVKPAEITVIEDSQKGLIAARSAGMRCIIVPNTQTKHHDFSKADIVLKRIGLLTPARINNLLSK